MLKFAVITRNPQDEPGVEKYIHHTADTPTLRQAIGMLNGSNTSWQKSHIQTVIPFPNGAKQMGPVQAFAAMLGEMAKEREARIVVFSKKLPILPHRPYYQSGSQWYTLDHAGDAVLCPDPNKVVPLQPAPKA